MMKRKLILLAVLACSSLFAQTDTEKFKISKSKWVVGGNLSIYSSTSKSETEDLINKSEQDSKEVNFNPSIGYAIKDNLITGLTLRLGRSKSNRDANGVSSETTSNSFGVAPYIQQYISMGEKFSFDVRGEVSYTKLKNNSDRDLLVERNNLFIGFKPGLTLKLNKKIALQTSIGSFGYSNYESKNRYNKWNGDSFSFDLNLREFNFGILVLL